ncbi:MAG: alginate export family protein [Candidatus Omnitrophica bacterium]|nr:alginate export family protein [Candidatus Omnitrophota bacterium]
MKFLRVLSVIALVAFMATGVYAETQNVKVSGDLAVRGFFRDGYQANGSFASQNEQSSAYWSSVATGGGAAGVPAADAADTRIGVDRSNSQWFMSTTELQIDADLTDNVSTCIRLVNQRDWNVARSDRYNRTAQLGTIGSGGFGHSTAYQTDDNEFAVDLELAYLTLKNFIYSPLTVSIGRQNLWFGKGFIVGANQRVRNAGNFGLTNGPSPLSAPEYTALNAFDSVKAVLDFDPWTLTAVYSKIWGNSIQADDGLDLWGANVGYKFDAYKGEAEGYWFLKRDNQVKAWNWANPNANNSVSTLGLRGSFDPIDIITLYGEFAGQFGSYAGNQLQSNNRSRLAGALDVGGELRYFTDKWAWKPKLGVEFIWYSGNDPEDTAINGSGQYTGWDPMFRGKTDSLIREFIGRYYFSSSYPYQGGRYYNSADASFTNQYQVIFSGSLQPMDSLKLTGNVNLFWNQYQYITNFTRTHGYVGTEFDCGATWDYTEDVSFNLAMGYFMPGDVYTHAGTHPYENPGDSTATDIVASVKVSF